MKDAAIRKKWLNEVSQSVDVTIQNDSFMQTQGTSRSFLSKRLGGINKKTNLPSLDNFDVLNAESLMWRTSSLLSPKKA